MKDAYRLLVIVASLFCFHLSASNTAGVWKGRLTMTGASGEMRRDVTLRLEVNGSGLTGTMTAESEPVEILDGTVKSDEVFFAIESGADDMPRFEFHGSVVSDTLTVTVTGRLKETGEVLKIGAGVFQRVE